MIPGVGLELAIICGKKKTDSCSKQLCVNLPSDVAAQIEAGGNSTFWYAQFFQLSVYERRTKSGPPVVTKPFYNQPQQQLCMHCTVWV